MQFLIHEGSPNFLCSMSTASHIWGEIFKEIHAKNPCTSVGSHSWIIHFSAQMVQTFCPTYVTITNFYSYVHKAMFNCTKYCTTYSALIHLHLHYFLRVKIPCSIIHLDIKYQHKLSETTVKIYEYVPLSIVLYITVIHKAEPSIFTDVPTSSGNCTEKFMSFYGGGILHSIVTHHTYLSPRKVLSRQI